jgi:hypothetical protein
MVNKIAGRTPPSGRGELLDWINALCCATYDTLEHLGDGVLYCQVLEMLLVDAPCFLHKLSSFDCLDHSASNRHGSGGRSGGLMQERRERNLGLFQVMCRQYLPKRQSMEINTTRLAEGKLQDHMILAKWLYARVADAAKTTAKGLRFVVDAELRRVEAACGIADAPNGTGDRAPFAPPKPLALELEPAPDAGVRMRRQRLLPELAKLEARYIAAHVKASHHASADEFTAGSSPPQTGTAASHTQSQAPPPTYSPEAYVAARAVSRGASPPSTTPYEVEGTSETQAMLHDLQDLLVAKARRVSQLQQHLEQFVEMRNGLTHVSEHLELEAERAATSGSGSDRRLAATVLHTLEAGETTGANVFSVVGEATRP